MLIHVKLQAMLEQYTPAGYIPGQVFPLEVAEGATVADVAAQLGIRPQEIKVAYVNGKARAAQYRLREGDEIGFFPPLGGG